MQKIQVHLMVAILLCCGAGLGASRYFHVDAPAPAATRAPVTLAPGERAATPFKLPKVDGSGEFNYDPAAGPLFIMLSAVECAGCHARVPVDQQGRALATKAGVRSLSVIVYGDPLAAKRFVADTHQAADDVVVDSNGAVAVNTYGGSDGGCWLLVNDGKIVWQGGSNLDQLKGALAKV